MLKAFRPTLLDIFKKTTVPVYVGAVSLLFLLMPIDGFRYINLRDFSSDQFGLLFVILAIIFIGCAGVFLSARYIYNKIRIFYQSQVVINQNYIQFKGLLHVGQKGYEPQPYDKRLLLGDIQKISGQKYNILGYRWIDGNNRKVTVGRGFRLKFYGKRKKILLSVESTDNVFGMGQLINVFNFLRKKVPHISFEGYSFWATDIEEK